MRVDVTPRQAEIVPGVELPLTVTITNTSSVIGGYAIRILGADPGWVALDADQLSLFPEESRTVTVYVTPPRGIAAGTRRIAVQVRELTPPEGSSITEVDLTVPAAKGVLLRVDPLAVTAGKHAGYSVILENTGNTVVDGMLAGDDPESKVRFRFTPPAVILGPGEHALVDMRATARRPLLGSPVIRLLGLYLDEPPTDPFFNGPDPDRAVPHDERQALGTATFIQKPAFSRGAVGLLGLLAAVTVFALVITLALSRIVGQTTADRDLALQVAAAANNKGGAGGTASVSGVVHDLSTGKPVSSVSVTVFQASDTSTPVATTATANNGTYSVGNLGAGNYKISFRGAQFQQLWYPAATTDADAATIALEAGTQKTNLNVTIGGLPASIGGRVVGDDVSTATLYLMKPPDTGNPTVATAGTAPVSPGGATTPGASAPPPDNGDAIVESVPIGADGMFTLANVPSPSTYDLVVTKTGYATTTQRLDVGAGENRTGIQLTLSKGDGVISGTVNSSAGPLGDVTITATSGQSSATTVSLTETGAFTLRGLPTPASFTVQASLPGYAQQTETVALAAGEKLTGVAITLSKSSASLAGVVLAAPANRPAPGVSVTVTNGSTTVQTSTQSAQGGEQGVGQWTASGLPVPDTYTITFSRADLASQTVSISLDGAGQITPGSRGANVDSNGLISVTMQSATATVAGVVSQHLDASLSSQSKPVGEVTVSLSAGTNTFTVTTASVPAKQIGHYSVSAIPPGTWTISVSRAGTSPTSTIVTLSAGQVLSYNPVLAAPASIAGKVTNSDGGAISGWVVQVYVASQYPAVVSYTTTTRSDGTFDFPDVDAPQAYVVAIRPTLGSADVATKDIQVSASQPSNVNFVVPS
jgi:5-hydroxyisourate hydrolase-like protein (transthyretin family)